MHCDHRLWEEWVETRWETYRTENSELHVVVIREKFWPGYQLPTYWASKNFQLRKRLDTRVRSSGPEIEKIWPRWHPRSTECQGNNGGRWDLKLRSQWTPFPLSDLWVCRFTSVWTLRKTGERPWWQIISRMEKIQVGAENFPDWGKEQVQFTHVSQYCTISVSQISLLRPVSCVHFPPLPWQSLKVQA